MESSLSKLIDNSVEVKIRIIKVEKDAFGNPMIDAHLTSIQEGVDHLYSIDWRFEKDVFIKFFDMIESHATTINKRIEKDNKIELKTN